MNNFLKVDVPEDNIPDTKQSQITEDFITVPEGVYQGVSYKINNANFEEKDGKHYLKFDYDVKNLEEGKEKEFEQFLGEFLIHSLKTYVSANQS